MKTKNPLFIVKTQTNEFGANTQVVEQANGLWDAFYKKFNLQVFSDLFAQIIELLSKYGTLQLAEKILSQLIENFRTLYENFMVFLRLGAKATQK